MSEMFALSAPWWHFVLRAVAVYMMVMVLIRISGKRAVGQFTPFDLVLLILIGNAVQNGLNGGDNSLTGALILSVCLIALNYGIAYLSSRSARARAFLESHPVVLARNGRIFEDAMRREMVSDEDLREALRLNNIHHVDDIGVAILETNGSISVLPKESISGRVYQPPDRWGRRRRRPGHPDAM